VTVEEERSKKKEEENRLNSYSTKLLPELVCGMCKNKKRKQLFISIWFVIDNI
jgi:hypothetical protein